MKKRIFRTTRREGKRRNEATEEKKPYMESLLAKFRCGWRGVLEIAQECFFLRKETEGLILATQEQALRTNSVKHSIYMSSETPLCRLCGESTEIVWHIVSGCRKLAQKEYRKRHAKVALQAHWAQCRKYGLKCNDTWYDQRIEK